MRTLNSLSSNERQRFDDSYAEILERVHDVENDNECESGTLAGRALHDREYDNLLQRFNIQR